MIFYVSNNIRVSNPSITLKRWAMSHLVLPNPEFYKKEKLGKWTGGTPEKIWLFEYDGNDMILPFGCVNELMELFPTAKFMTNIRMRNKINYSSDILLYDYQLDAVNEALKKKNGVIVMPCGAGKTQTALEIIARLSCKCLWLTHTQDLLNQSMNRAKSILNAPLKTYGTITGGKVNIGSGITFATIQTMSSLDLIKYKESWDAIIIDECHKAVGSPTKVMQFYKVISNLSCRYKIGLTATPKRADGLEESMFALIGPIIHEVDKKKVESTTCPIMIETVRTNYTPDVDKITMGDGTINYASLVDDLIHNDERFNNVSNWICKNKNNGPMLILANRVEYLEKLCSVIQKSEYKAICLSSLGNSKAAKKIRKEALKNLNNGELDCVLATYQLAKEGLDVPNLRYVVFATPEKDETTITQSVGRVGRKAVGKDYGTVIDFVDDFGMYNGWHKKRLAVYRKLGCYIDIL